MVNLRPITRQSADGSNPGYGIFVLSAPNASVGTLLGQKISDILDSTKLSTIKTALNLSSAAFTNTTILDILWDLLTKYADPDGTTAVRPLMPTIRGNLELHIGGFSLVRREHYDPAKHPLVLQVVQNNYQKIKTGGGDSYRRYLSVVAAKLKVPWQEIIPLDLPQEEPLPPHTAIHDDFTRADQTPLGTSSEGWSWYTVWGTWSIASNQAKCTGTGTDVNHARAEQDLSTDDMYVQSNVWYGSSLNICVQARESTANDGTNWAFYYAGPSSATLCQLCKKVAGGGYSLIDSHAITYSAGALVKIIVDGSSISYYYNGSLLNTVTDTDITGNLRSGIQNYSDGNGLHDNFEAADYAPAPIIEMAPDTEGLTDAPLRRGKIVQITTWKRQVGI